MNDEDRIDRNELPLRRGGHIICAGLRAVIVSPGSAGLMIEVFARRERAVVRTECVVLARGAAFRLKNVLNRIVLDEADVSPARPGRGRAAP